MQIVEGNQGQKLFVLERGEPLMQTITQYCTDHKLPGGNFSGIGAVEKTELGFYDLSRKEYFRRTFDEECELVGMNGNLTLKEGAPFLHIHASIADREYRVFGGHLFETRCAVTVEIHYSPLGALPERSLIPEIGLHLICGLS